MAARPHNSAELDTSASSSSSINILPNVVNGMPLYEDCNYTSFGDELDCEGIGFEQKFADLAHTLRPGEFKMIDVCNGQQIKLDSKVLDCIAAPFGTRNSLLSDHLGSLQYLGKGAFGEAHKYSPPECKNLHIVIKQDNLGDKCDNPGWKREVEHTRGRSHDNILQYFGKPIIYDSMIYNIMEYCGESIESLYFTRSIMPEEEIEKAMLDVAKGLDYLHSTSSIDGKYLVHRDIRTANITVNDKGVYKIIDFGLSSEVTDEDSRYTSKIACGHPFWKSPEHVRYERAEFMNPYLSTRTHSVPVYTPHRHPSSDIVHAQPQRPGRKSDIWSYGVFVFEMKAFPKRPEHFKLHRSSFGIELTNERINLLEDVKDEWSDKIKCILRICLEVCEEERADSQILLEFCQGKRFCEKQNGSASLSDNNNIQNNAEIENEDSIPYKTKGVEKFVLEGNEIHNYIVKKIETDEEIFRVLLEETDGILTLKVMQSHLEVYNISGILNTDHDIDAKLYGESSYASLNIGKNQIRDRNKRLELDSIIGAMSITSLLRFQANEISLVVKKSTGRKPKYSYFIRLKDETKTEMAKFNTDIEKGKCDILAQPHMDAALITAMVAIYYKYKCDSKQNKGSPMKTFRKYLHRIF